MVAKAGRAEPGHGDRSQSQGACSAAGQGQAAQWSNSLWSKPACGLSRGTCMVAKDGRARPEPGHGGRSQGVIFSFELSKLFTR